jgi:hypothetical protein
MGLPAHNARAEEEAMNAHSKIVTGLGTFAAHYLTREEVDVSYQGFLKQLDQQRHTAWVNLILHEGENEWQAVYDEKCRHLTLLESDYDDWKSEGGR